MLRDEDGMPAPRRLATVVWRLGRSKTPRNEIFGMLKHSRKSPLVQVAVVLVTKAKAPAEGRTGESREDGVQITHRP